MLRHSLCLFPLLLFPHPATAQAPRATDVDTVLYAGTSAPGIFAVHPKSGTTVNLTQGRVRMEDGWGHPWQPVGSNRKAVFKQWRRKGEGYESRVFLLEARRHTVQIHQVPGVFDSIMGFTWSNDNLSFALVDSFLGTSSGDEVVVVTGNEVAARIPVGLRRCHASWSPDGRWIAVLSHSDGALLLIATEDYSLRPVPLAGPGSRVAWGPDSQRLAVVLNGTLSVVDLEGNVLQTFGGASEVHRWSPDGRYLSYETRNSPPPTDRRVFRLFLGGAEAVNSGYPDETGGEWSPDSRALALWAGDGTNSYALMVGADGTHPTVLANASGFTAPSWFKMPRDMLLAARR